MPGLRVRFLNSLASIQPITLAFSVVLSAGAVIAQPSAETQQQPSKEMLSIAKYLNEFSDRRRLNTFFINEQSPFNGVQVGYVNTSAGNLTFLRRDLVRLSRLPLVFGRVYDSRIEDNADFGPGWKIAPMEYPEETAEGFVYTDSSGSKFVFRRSGSLLELTTPFYSDFLSAEVLPDGIEFTMRSLWSQFFMSTDHGYSLTRVTDNSGNTMRYSYDGNLLKSIETDWGRVSLVRDGDGRVTRVVDDLGRSVSYRYDNKRRLGEAVDLGGNRWTYDYTGRGLLRHVVDPLGNSALQVSYDGQPRVKQADIRNQKHSYKYHAGQTEVSNAMGQRGVFAYNESGVTRLATNALGLTTEVTFDGENRPIALRAAGRPVAEFEYGADGNPATMWRFDELSGTVIQYRYNWQNRLLTAESTNGERLEFQYDENGQLVRRRLGDELREYEFSASGDLKAVRRGSEEYRFEHSGLGLITAVYAGEERVIDLQYSPEGRLVGATFTDGSHSINTYNALGFRTSRRDSDGTAIDFQYDAAGNLREISGERDGLPFAKSLILNADNDVVQVQEASGSNLDLAYDHRGNPTRATVGAWRTDFIYDKLGRLEAVKENGSVVASHEYDDFEPDLRLQTDDRTATSRHWQHQASAVFGNVAEQVYSRNIGSLFGGVAFSPDIQALELTGDWGVVDPDAPLLAALERMKLVDTEDEPTAQSLRFNRPSNVMFLPPELRTVNCEPEPGACGETGITSIVSEIDGEAGVNHPGIKYVTVPAGVDIAFDGQVTVNGCAPYLQWTFGEGAPVGLQVPFPYVLLTSHTYNTPGTYSAQFLATCDCEGPGASKDQDYSVRVIKATVLSADVTTDEIEVKLEPSTTGAGTLVVELAPDNHVVFNDTRAGGTHTISFGIPSLPNGKQFEKVEATWTVSGASTTHTKSLADSFKVIGDINQTVYNSPSQSNSTCATGTPSTTYITQDYAPELTNCWVPTSGWSTNSFTSTLISKIQLNGSGRLASGNIVQRDAYCPNQSSGRPAGANSSNTYRQRLAGPIPFCGTSYMVGNPTVAIDFDASGNPYSCGDKVLIHGLGVKTVTDRCPLCGLAKMDNYNSSEPRCSGIVGLNVRKTLRLF